MMKQQHHTLKQLNLKKLLVKNLVFLNSIYHFITIIVVYLTIIKKIIKRQFKILIKQSKFLAKQILNFGLTEVMHNLLQNISNKSTKISIRQFNQIRLMLNFIMHRVSLFKVKQLNYHYSQLWTQKKNYYSFNKQFKHFKMP